jgi:diguanylate cyclase (GGDEF)-like protein
VLGTFAIYYGEPRCPNPDDFERMGFASNLAAIAIEHQCVHEELERRAYTDDLTGLANRRRFLEQAEEELARVQRYGTALSLVMLDIDRFKQVNDHHGHKVGDLVLQHLAQVCRTVLRDVDVVGRIGGEEFAVLLPHTGCAAALDAAERLRAALAESRVALGDGRELLFTVSMGVATLCEGCTGIDALLIAADRALYQAKAGGRNRVCGMAVPPAAA